MVAMTVVLTAVLYIMVIGMSGTDVGANRYGSVELYKISSTAFDVRFGKFEPMIKPMQLEILVEFEGDEGTYVFASDYDGNLTKKSGIDLCDMYYDDLGGNGWVNVGDYIRVTNLSPQGKYTIYVLDTTTGAQIVAETIIL
jgi:hypothetical protein